MDSDRCYIQYLTMYLKYPIITPSINATYVSSDRYNMQLQYLTMYLSSRSVHDMNDDVKNVMYKGIDFRVNLTMYQVPNY